MEWKQGHILSGALEKGPDALREYCDYCKFIHYRRYFTSSLDLLNGELTDISLTSRKTPS